LSSSNYLKDVNLLFPYFSLWVQWPLEDSPAGKACSGLLSHVAGINVSFKHIK
jgi:hypothetical protein